MGVDIAHAAVRSGSSVTLLRGPATIAPDPSLGITDCRFESAAELEDLLSSHWPLHDILFMAAAVADFRPTFTPGKIRRESALDLQAEPVPDLLAALAAGDPPWKVRIGFALEPMEDLEASAERKLRLKNLTGIVANPLDTLNAQTIQGFLLLDDGTKISPSTAAIAKPLFAEWLVKQVLDKARTMPSS